MNGDAGLRVLVVDDEPLARGRVVRLLRPTPWIGMIEEAGNVREAAARIAATQPDILLLDIQMPDGTGFDLLQSLDGPVPALVFITAFDDQALRAFDANAVDYVTKPIEPGRLHAALERARQAAAHKANADRITELEEVVATLRRRVEPGATRSPDLWVKAQGDYVRLALPAISHILAERDYVRIFSEGRDYLHNASLSSIEADLPGEEFLRIHRSTIVRLDAVERVKSGRFSSLIAVLADGSEHRIGRTYTADFRSKLAGRVP